MVRWGFARLYTECAGVYDLVARLVSRGLWYRWTLAALPFLHGRVLELGCGTGVVQCALAQAGRVAVGLDTSPNMLALARRRARTSGVDLHLLRGCGQALPVATGSCDTILATFPAEYILETATAAEIARVLTPNGRFVLVDAAQLATNDLQTRLIDLAYRIVFGAAIHTTPPTQLRLPNLEAQGFTFAYERVTIGPSSVLVLVGTPGKEPADAANR